MKTPKTKNLALSIGLNIVLPGLGYLYQGKWLVGIIGGALVLAMYAASGPLGIFLTWALVNIIMAIDMKVLNSRRNKQIESATTKKCVSCAELIQREAKKCRFCGERLTN